MSTFWNSPINHPVGPEPAQPHTAMLLGLRALKEGAAAQQQPRAFVNIMFEAALRDFIMTRGARYFLTEKGRAFINGQEWSETT